MSKSGFACWSQCWLRLSLSTYECSGRTLYTSGNVCSLIFIGPCTFDWVPSAQRAADIACGHPLRYALVVKGVLAADEAPQELLIAEGVQADAAVLSVLCGSSTPVPSGRCKLEALKEGQCRHGCSRNSRL